jgi:uncharacterized protein YrrD
MLDKIKTLNHYKLDSLDGEIGKAQDFYFDDRHWTIRYLVVKTEGWLTGKPVLISPYALVGILKMDKKINIHLTKKQIEDSPSWNSDKPVSRQFEENYYTYYKLPMYWTGPYMWGYSPSLIQVPEEKWKEATHSKKVWDSHLRSTNEVLGYSIQAINGEIGHIEDFIIDDETWAIRYLLINTAGWWPGKKVLVSPQWIDHVSWNESKIFVKLPQEAIKQSPEYSETFLISRDYEAKLHQHYNHQGYWVDEPTAKVPSH